MVVEERPPSLGGRPALPHHVLGDSRFGDLDSEFQQLAVNAWGTPAWVVPAHDPNQIPHLLWHSGPSWLALSDFPTPEESEALPVPRDDRLGLDNDQSGFPIGPHAPQPDP